MERISQLHHRSSRASRATDILTTRERQVLLAYAEGCGRREISGKFQISPNTVSHALTLAKEKLGARSITQAAVLFSLWFETVRG
jgi:DNA-binding CsgD family transcriptional regulator